MWPFPSQRQGGVAGTTCDARAAETLRRLATEPPGLKFDSPGPTRGVPAFALHECVYVLLGFSQGLGSWLFQISSAAS